MMKVFRFILLLFLFSPVMSQDITLNLGDSLEIEIDEVAFTVNNIAISRENQRYSLYIEKQSPTGGSVSGEFLLFQTVGTQLPFNGNGSTIFIVDSNTLSEPGEYKLFGWVTRFVPGNDLDNRFIQGETSDTLVVVVKVNAPVIVSVEPAGLVVGEPFTIRGSNFIDVQRVIVGNTATDVFVVDSTMTIINLDVPFGATSGTLMVVTLDGLGVYFEDVKVIDFDKPKKFIMRIKPGN